MLATGLATNPEVTIVCGPRERDPEDENAVTSLTALVEVLSNCTEDYDRGDKFEHCKRIASLHRYVLVSHRDRAIEVWSRVNGDDWTNQVAREGGRADLATIGALLEVKEVYDAAAEPCA